MCKNLFVLGVSKEAAKDNLWKFLIEATPFMTARDNDGLGYVATGRRGLWGERWFDTDKAWKDRTILEASEEDLEVIKRLPNLLKLPEQTYNRFGAADPDGATSVLLHSRMATCDKNLTNVHPFVSNDGKTALVHNGVISNSKQIGTINSTCDSESILKLYLDNGVSKDPNSITQVIKELQGYFACGVMGTDAEGISYVDVFKNDTAGLCVSMIKELNSLVLCTNKEILENTCKKLGFTMSRPVSIADDIMIRFNAITGDVMSTHKYSSNARYSSYSGRTYDRDWDYGGY